MTVSNNISVFDLFSIGVGPSSSHTVGPMRAANLFLELLKCENNLDKVEKVTIELYGSLALTGKGHRTDYAVIIGLEGNRPEDADPDISQKDFLQVLSSFEMNLAGQKKISFNYDKDLIFYYDQVLPHHPNGLRFNAFSSNGSLIGSKEFYSVGGGFVVSSEDFAPKSAPSNQSQNDSPTKIPYEFSSAQELLEHCKQNNKTIAQILLANELVFRSERAIKDGVLKIWRIMHNCIDRGLKNSGILPGGLNIKRRAPDLFVKLSHARNKNPQMDSAMNWLSLYAISVNEENASGGKVVTAPTNGAAGVIPSVLKYYSTHLDCTDDKIIDFLLTAAAIGILYKKRASLSAAEVGCQGEVGVACSMAAAAYAAVKGGSIYQVENAAEIGMEHHLGLTCDPIGGLVQIPCIERNAAGAVQAINSAQLALLGDGEHYVSLDKVINTMRETGRDMMTKYKETSQGGLAVNLPEC